MSSPERAVPDRDKGLLPVESFAIQERVSDNANATANASTAVVPNGASSPSKQQRIIDDLLQHLAQCMQEKSALEVQNQVLQRRLLLEQTEAEKSTKSLLWYKRQLHDTQQALRLQHSRDEDKAKLLKSDQESLRVQLQKSQFEYKILHERFQLEKNRQHQQPERDHHELLLSIRHDSKDSGIFSESNTSDTCSEVIDFSSFSSSSDQQQQPMKELADLRQELAHQQSLYQELFLDKGKLQADRDLWHEKCQLQRKLLTVHESNAVTLKSQLEAANKTVTAKTLEHSTAVNYLNQCRAQVEVLMRENSDIHRESLQMILKFERIASILAEYRRQIQHRDTQLREQQQQQQRMVISSERSTQTINTNAPPVACERAAQTTISTVAGGMYASSGSVGCPESPSTNYYKNLLKVVEREYREKLRQREINTRTLLKKLRMEMRRVRELEEGVRVIRRRVFPGGGGDSVGVDEILRELIESSFAVDKECKSCVELKQEVNEGISSVAQLKDKKIDLERSLQMLTDAHVKEVEELKCKLLERTSTAEAAKKTIELLEMDQLSLHSSLDLLKSKFIAMEQQVLEHAKLKDSAASDRERHHQVMLLLLQIKNERDDLLCQNERLLRGLAMVQEGRRHAPSLTDRAREMLKRSANLKGTSGLLEPLSQGILALREEVATLNSSILQCQTSGEMSLLDELQAAFDEDV